MQCAAQLAAVAPDDDELIVAGLVHDIGHRLQPAHPVEHGRFAADAVRGLLGERVATLVELHVPAKRYLVTVDDSYGSTLSTGSTASLVRQGGRLDDDERAALEQRPELTDALTLRRADEAAKDPDAVVPGLDHWRPLVEHVATNFGVDSGAIATTIAPNIRQLVLAGAALAFVFAGVGALPGG